MKTVKVTKENIGAVAGSAVVKEPTTQCLFRKSGRDFVQQIKAIRDIVLEIPMGDGLTIDQQIKRSVDLTIHGVLQTLDGAHGQPGYHLFKNDYFGDNRHVAAESVRECVYAYHSENVPLLTLWDEIND